MINKDIFLSFDKNKVELVSYSCTGLYEEKYKDKIIVSTHKPLVEDTFFHGIEIDITSERIIIRNDFFCSIPIYYSELDDYIFVASNPSLLKENGVSFNLDEVGFWQAVYFSNCIYDRTPIIEVKQLPPLHQILIDSKGMFISKYKKLEFFEDKSKSVEEILSKIDDRLMDIFNGFNIKEHYSIGVSGGLDSRLSLGYLNRCNFNNNTHAFTFFASENSLELKLADELCTQLGYSKPEKFLLSPEHYTDYMCNLDEWTAGQIGFHHSHIIQCLDSDTDNNQQRKQISNYYTDAVFGWATGPKEDTSKDSWTSIIESSLLIPESIKSLIYEDISKVFSDYKKDHNFSCKDEYKYVFERNQKFHINLAFQQNRYCETYLPYCDYHLLKLVFSLPLTVRENKKISDILILRCGITEFESISSRQMVSGKSFSQKAGFTKLVDNYLFKLNNALTLISSKLSNGLFVFPNKYQTEAHYNIYHKLRGKGYFASDLEYLQQCGVINSDGKDIINNISPRNGGVSFYFQLHSVVSYLRSFD